MTGFTLEVTKRMVEAADESPESGIFLPSLGPGLAGYSSAFTLILKNPEG